MTNIYLAPAWFFGYDVIFEFTFFLVAMSIAIFSRRIYKESSIPQLKLLSMSFMFISISYLIQSIFSYLSYSELNEQIVHLSEIYSVIFFDTTGMYLHILFMMAGLAVLFFMTLNSHDSRVLWALLLLTVISILLSSNTLLSYYILSSAYLVFITWHFMSNYFRNKQARTLLIALAFLFLLFGSIHLFLSVNHQVFFVIANFLELAAYILILVNLYLVCKK